MEEKRKGYIKINRYVVLGLFVFFLLTVGATYAYYTYQVEDTVAIKGNIVSVNATLNVELISGTNDEMVPLQDAALLNAINGNGGTDACVDSVGNLSCQVYKITLTNNGSRLQNLKGSVELYAKSGSTYTNLKWKELTNATTLKDGVTTNGMEKTTLVSGLTLESKASQTWYIAVWISETDTDQSTTDTGDFGGTVTFEVDNTGGSGAIEQYIAPNAVLDNTTSTYVTSSTGISFSSISSDTNGKGVYILSSTASDTHPIYYYRGAVDNNNVLFANFCWKIVRTTETGGIKLIYNGTPTDGTCDNTGTSSQIGTSTFNSSYSDNAYVGYMYGTTGSSSYDATHTNTNNSTIKGVIDNWYASNMTSYTSKLEDTVWCNDRSIDTISGYGNGLGYGTNETAYMARYRLYTNKTPSLECSQANDRFTVSTDNGNGALTYPVGLLTADEIAYAGGVYNTSNSTYYLYTGENWWAGSSYYFNDNYAFEFHVDSYGYLYNNYVINSFRRASVVVFSPRNRN